MNIRRDRNFQVTPDGRKNLAAISHTNPAKRAHRSSVGFVVGSFKNKIDIFRCADFRDLFCHTPGEFLRLNHAWAEDECRVFATNADSANVQRLCSHNE
jgi:hypothetical protein